MDVAKLFHSIGITRDYSSLDLTAVPRDTQGWGSQHPCFKLAIDTAKPALAIEVGTWKGASLLNMHALTRKAGLATRFICVDTWLGSNEVLWRNPGFRASLNLKGGYPNMFPQFIRNITDAGIADDVFPVPMTSSGAYFLLKKLGIVADLAYIDAGHEEDEVYLDLKYYYDLLRPGGVLFGDDYRSSWPGVIAAVNRFAADTRQFLYTWNGKFMLVKPGGAAATVASAPPVELAAPFAPHPELAGAE